MNGRDMNELKIFDSIQNKLNILPPYVNDWYLNIRASGCTASTCADFVGKISHFLRFINEDPLRVKICDINESVTTQYFLSIKAKTDKNGNQVYTSDSYQYSVWACLNNFMKYCVKRGDLDRNYMDFIRRPKNNDLERINNSRVLLSKEDFKSIQEAVETETNDIRKKRDTAILSIFMSTGMRKTALSNIMVSDIDLVNRELKVVDKGNICHIYYLSDTLCDQISQWLDVRSAYDKHHSSYLFLSQKNGKLGTRTIADIVEKYTGKALGQKVSPHKLRSGYCSILYDETHDIEFVRRAVGHSRVDTTQRYIVTKRDERKRAADLLNDIFN